jgi:hypothetical protein
MTPIGGYFARETPQSELPCEGGVAVNFGPGGLELQRLRHRPDRRACGRVKYGIMCGK